MSDAAEHERAVDARRDAVEEKDGARRIAAEKWARAALDRMQTPATERRG